MTDPSSLEVLLIDDEKNIRTILGICLEGLGCRVSWAATAEAARTAVASRSFDLAFLDLRLGETNGLDLLPGLLAQQPALAVVVVSAHAALDAAVDAIQRGAVDYLPKPFTPAQIRYVVLHLDERRQAMRPPADLD